MTDILNLRSLLVLARETVSDPKSGAAQILALNLPRSALYLCFALMVVSSLFFGEVLELLLPPPPAGPLTSQPALVMGLLQAAFLFLAIFAITYIGRAMGGTGEFDGALALMTWLQFIFLIVQLVQLAVLLILAPLAAVIFIASIVLFFWLLANFITVLHGFSSVGTVFAMTILSLVGIIFVLSIVLTILGIAPSLVTVSA